MELSENAVTVNVYIDLAIEKVWTIWTTASDIIQWNNPSDDWHSPLVNIDLRAGGEFLFRMEAKDSSMGFDHAGKYDTVILQELIEYTVSDGRRSVITFISDEGKTILVETFEPDQSIPVSDQEKFCQAVLNNFKRYAENKN